MSKKAPKLPPDPLPSDPPQPQFTPTPKHICSREAACVVRLSDIEKKYHTFPSGTFHLRFSPPTVPKFILAYFLNHPFSWKWTTRGGPNKGRSFPVPTIPTACTQVDHRAVRWTVDLFHSFKAHLTNGALFKGRVRPDIVKLYQNNMLIHYWSQLKALRSSSAAGATVTTHSPPQPSHATPCPPTQIGTVLASTPSNAITALLQRITALESELSQVKQLLQQGSPSAHPPPSRQPDLPLTQPRTPKPHVKVSPPQAPPTPRSSGPSTRSQGRNKKPPLQPLDVGSPLPTILESPVANRPDKPKSPSGQSSTVVEQTADSLLLGSFPPSHFIHAAAHELHLSSKKVITFTEASIVRSVTSLPSTTVATIAVSYPRGNSCVTQYLAVIKMDPTIFALLDASADAPEFTNCNLDL
ncbi:hypothetical protein JVT61DRAFT_10990 [Boletus reticuloceps]|uniref:Uncharacterized protein n=1 Tax=Boletus reticuloceps TaxID=495285 RepID=A0A8I3A4H4_9AGAM|nr:hypothetical protein JVT61DRAFT_10990 [Boletus reticuloceps]